MDIQPWSLHQLDQLDEDKDSSTVLGIIERAQRERDILNSIEGGRANQNNNTGGGTFTTTLTTTTTTQQFRRTSFLPKITYARCVRGGGRYTKNVRRFGSFDNLLVPNPEDDGLSSSISLNELAQNNNGGGGLRRSASNQDISMNTFNNNNNAEGDSDSEYGEVTTSAFNDAATGAPDDRQRDDGGGGPPVFKTKTTTTANRINNYNASATKSNSGASGNGTGYVQDASDFDRVLIEAWEDRFAGGLFRYDVTAVLTRLIEGPSRYVAQYNEGRATKKRQTEFKMDLVCQEFDGKKFNFTKADQKEVLFTFEEQDEDEEENENEEPGRTEFIERGEISKSPNLVLINVSPIEYGHVLLCPRVSEMLPQQIFADALIPPLRMCAESKNPYFRVGYNSLGAYATINHLHFQAYYLMEAFPIERALSKPFAEDVFKNPKRPMGKQVHAECLRVYDYPVRCIVFELGSKGFVDLAKWIGRACSRLQKRNIPFNLLMTDHGARVFLIPQIFSHKIAQNKIPEWIVDTGINPAVFEISGHMLFKREEDYEICSEAMASGILASASIEEDEFCDLMREVLDRERIEEGEEESNEDGDDNNENKNKARRSEEEGSAQMTVKL